MRKDLNREWFVLSYTEKMKNSHLPTLFMNNVDCEVFIVPAFRKRISGLKNLDL